MTVLQSIILAIVEGLTEFLPVSSTGHMVLAEGLMGMESDSYTKAFTVIIQFGAMLSVLVLYWRRFFDFRPLPGMTQPVLRMLSRFRFYGLLLLGVLPAAILGLLFEKYIDHMLGSVLVVALMLLLGGVFMLFVDKMFASSNSSKPTPRSALIIGLYQCLAMVPGVSRSMATIVGGMQQGLSRKAAAEFSFFLALPTMLGATLLKIYKLYKEGGQEIFMQHMDTLLIGNILAFIVALLAIKGFVSFLTKYGFRAFGYYRIAMGSLILLLMLCGIPLNLQ